MTYSHFLSVSTRWKYRYSFQWIYFSNQQQN